MNKEKGRKSSTDGLDALLDEVIQQEADNLNVDQQNTEASTSQESLNEVMPPKNINKANNSTSKTKNDPGVKIKHISIKITHSDKIELDHYCFINDITIQALMEKLIKSHIKKQKKE